MSFSALQKHLSIEKHVVKNIYYSVRKVSNIFFLRKPCDFNEAHLHEAVLNLHIHA